jgi:DHA1 family tetracycline resistance protein-like MFS transporter
MNLMGVSWPAAQSIMSRTVPPNEQGQLQGAVNSLRGIAGLVGPGLFTYVFAKSIGVRPLLPTMGSPFYLAALLLVGGVGLIVVGTRERAVAA